MKSIIIKYYGYCEHLDTFLDSFSQKIVSRYRKDPTGIIYYMYNNNIPSGYIILRNNIIVGFFIREEDRNKGLGSKLLRYVIDDNKGLEIISYVTKNSINCYKNQGFNILYESVSKDHYIVCSVKQPSLDVIKQAEKRWLNPNK